ncbi:hypothetical protein TNCV_2448981 [Trichonephila clavipes]|uniref:Uncharacterized protein n=1 Tax=Trichonephila clavipes TaxID=2585209 RepID=A0A8X6SF54_TRICX|nr:hypothetical protein TNCV_2448981 [Trichonephila clavipes]
MHHHTSQLMCEITSMSIFLPDGLDEPKTTTSYSPNGFLDDMTEYHLDFFHWSPAETAYRASIKEVNFDILTHVRAERSYRLDVSHVTKSS